MWIRHYRLVPKTRGDRDKQCDDVESDFIERKTNRILVVIVKCCYCEDGLLRTSFLINACYLILQVSEFQTSEADVHKAVGKVIPRVTCCFNWIINRLACTLQVRFYIAVKGTSSQRTYRGLSIRWKIPETFKFLMTNSVICQLTLVWLFNK